MTRGRNNVYGASRYAAHVFFHSYPSLNTYLCHGIFRSRGVRIHSQTLRCRRYLMRGWQTVTDRSGSNGNCYPHPSVNRRPKDNLRPMTHGRNKRYLLHSCLTRPSSSPSYAMVRSSLATCACPNPKSISYRHLLTCQSS